MQDFFNIIGNFGFPVTVAGYLLFRFESKLEALTIINTQLNNEISSLKREIVDLKQTIKEQLQIGREHNV